MSTTAATTAPRVVIVGAGFGGLAAAKRLEKHVDVTLIDRHNYHTFLPLLYQVSTAGLNAADVGYPVRGVFRRKARVRFRQGRVTRIDWQRKAVAIEDAEPVPFDKLILAAGSATNYFGVPGAKEHTFPLYTLPDALRVRNHLLSLFEAADTRPDLIADGVLNFVVVGGGATGVEVSGAIVELIGKVLQHDFHDLDVSAARVILVERTDTLLGPFSQKSRDYALAQLRKKGVEVMLRTAVAEVAADRVRFEDGTILPTRMVVWAAGIQADPLAGTGGWDQGPGGRITVGPDLSVEGHPDVFAIGDIANIDDGAGGRLPQLAQVALQGGKFAAKQILRDLAGEPREAFHYRDKGTMATIGRRAAVAELAGGARLKGFLAWLAWLGLHLLYLVGMRNRLSVLVNWGWNYLTWDRGPRLIVAAEPMPSRPQLTAGPPLKREIGSGSSDAGNDGGPPPTPSSGREPTQPGEESVQQAGEEPTRRTGGEQSRTPASAPEPQ